MSSVRREQSIYTILMTSLKLFRENSYANTTVRQIAEQSKVSLGMVNHYFGSKEYLGEQVLSLLSQYAFSPLPDTLSLEKDPVLYDLVMVRLFFNYVRTHGYWNFYIDSLQNDFFFKSLGQRPMTLANNLKNLYDFESDPDTLLLYSRYLPYMMEKTLILKKELGLFPSISYEEVPYLICSTAMNHFIPEEEIKKRNRESILIAERLGHPLLDLPPEEVVTGFIHDSNTFCK